MATVMPPDVSPGMGPVITTAAVAPIVIDLGKVKKKKIKALKRGRGKLMAEVSTVINDLRMNLGDEADGKQFIPVVLIYKQKRKRGKRGRSLLFPFLS